MPGAWRNQGWMRDLLGGWQVGGRLLHDLLQGNDPQVLPAGDASVIDPALNRGAFVEHSKILENRVKHYFSLYKSMHQNG
jgi:hypothetical protein